MSECPIITQVEFFETSYQTGSWRVQGRNFSSLTLRKSGKVSFFTTDGKAVSTAGMLTFIPAGCSYETEIEEAGEMLILHYCVQEGSPDLHTQPFFVRAEHAAPLTELFLRAIRHFQADEGYSCMADAYRILGEAAKLTSKTRPTPHPRIARCKEYMDAHVCDSDMRISMLASMNGTSEVYFRNEFKKFYHVTPVEYVKQRRMETACRLLRTKLYTVAEVATRAGFDSISYFSAEFRRRMGCSPREYRNL